MFLIHWNKQVMKKRKKTRCRNSEFRDCHAVTITFVIIKCIESLRDLGEFSLSPKKGIFLSARSTKK